MKCLKNKKIIFGLLVSACFFVYAVITYVNMPKLYQNEYILVGTFVKITSPDKRAAKIVFDVFTKHEKYYNIYDDDSVLSNVNKLAGQEAVIVGEDAFELFKLAKQAYLITEGVFDVSAGALINFWKSKISRQSIVKELPSKEELDQYKGLIGFDNVELNDQNKSVFIKKSGVMLDLGGIAKGFIVDKAVEALKEAGITSALINAGGDIYCLGKKLDRSWTVGVQDPSVNDILNTVNLIDKAVATSGNYQQFFEFNGNKFSHIINPKTLMPADTALDSVTVVAHNLSSADVFATTFFLMGVKETQKFLLKTNSNMKVYMLEKTKDGRKMHVLGDVL